jgi:rSAM/selenodomain-associated transferase 2
VRLSVVIPALNEARALPGTLARARRACPGAQILVVDGGSDDGTADVARTAGCVVIDAPRGRGRQQNAGASVASGGVLLFCHADTLLPDGTADAISRALADDAHVVGGNFRLAFDPPSPLNRLFAAVYNARARRRRHFYGDSCLWVRRDVFEAMGGFREGMLMEDWEFVQRLTERCGKRGERTVLLPLVVTTSARRFSGRRRWRYLWLWAKLHYLHARGVSGDRLAALYPDVR